MDCWKRFDMKAVALYTRHPRRTDGVRRELRRIGLDAEEFWDAPSAFTPLLVNVVPMKRFMDPRLRPGFLPATLAHYRMLKVLLERGARNVLCMENDVRFLQDRDELSRRVLALPEDFDLVLLDWEPPTKNWTGPLDEVLSAPRANGYWARFGDLRSFACYAMSRRFMEYWIASVELAASRQRPLLVCDMYCTPQVKPAWANTYACVPNAAVQAWVEKFGQGEPGGCAPEPKWEKYEKAGVDLRDYGEVTP